MIDDNAKCCHNCLYRAVEIAQLENEFGDYFIAICHEEQVGRSLSNAYPHPEHNILTSRLKRTRVDDHFVCKNFRFWHED